MGLTLEKGGANIAVYSEAATRVWVALFDANTGKETHHALPQRVGNVHCGFLKGVTEGMHYGLRADGPWEPDKGHHFDKAKLLLDPYARTITGPFHYHPDFSKHGMHTASHVPKAIANHTLPNLPLRKVPRPGLIYEVNVRGFTKLHPDVPEKKRGTIAALAEPSIIKHLKSIGVDTLELMPVAAWIDERHLVNLGLANAWGYNPVSFFAIEPRLAPGGLQELRTTVEALHAENISVVLDVVFNHSGEGDILGPALSFRGLDNAAYYRLFHGSYVNDTGCGNTLALDRPHTVALVVEALRHWVLQCGVDGFRFDLASIMGRDAHGFRTDAPLLDAINADPVLCTRLLIAEPWDMGPGGYQLGKFPNNWMEWNDHYRDDVRRFWSGNAYGTNALATRITGSSDVFAAKGKPSYSINFIAAHDGFTLKDTVTFTAKNNEANGEDNRDGKNGEPTWPGGNVAAFLATLLFSRGTAMLTAGDEFGRTQGGNNNAYAQDNETTWLDWKNKDTALLKQFQSLLALRSEFSAFFDDRFLTGQPAQGSVLPDAAWHGQDGSSFNWSRGGQSVLSLVVTKAERRICVFFNRGKQIERLNVTPRPGHEWRERVHALLDASCPPQSVAVYEEVPSREDPQA